MGRISKRTLLDGLAGEVAERLGEEFKVYADEKHATVTYSPDGGIQYCNVRVSYDRPDFRGKLPLEMPQTVIDGAVKRYQEESMSEKSTSNTVRLAAEAYRKIKHLASSPVRPAPAPAIGPKNRNRSDAPLIANEGVAQLLEAMRDLTLELQELTATLAKPRRFEVREINGTTTTEER